MFLSIILQGPIKYITSIDAMYGSAIFIVAVLTAWGLLTKRINTRIDSKVDQKVYKANRETDAATILVISERVSSVQKEAIDKITAVEKTVNRQIDGMKTDIEKSNEETRAEMRENRKEVKELRLQQTSIYELLIKMSTSEKGKV